MDGSDKGTFTEALDFSLSHIRPLTTAFVILGTLIPFAVFLFNIFNLSLVLRVIIAAVVVLVFYSLGSGLIIYYLLRKSKEGEGKINLLRCYSFDILLDDDGRARDDKHYYRRQDRTLDLSGEHIYFHNVYYGEVARNVDKSCGIPIKFIADHAIDPDKLDTTVVRHAPLEEGQNPVENTAEVIDSTMFDVILKLPFGTELYSGDKFKLEFECSNFGIAPGEENKEIRVHFPMHRFRRVGTFDATIKLNSSFTEHQAARVATVPDMTQNRMVQIDDINLEQDVDLTRQERSTHIEYTMHRDNEANSLFLFRFPRE